MDVEEAPFDDAALQATASKALRVILTSAAALTHTDVRAAVLGSDESHASKCMFELAIWSLVEQGVLVRQGAGGRALYSVLPAALDNAQDLAFREFPGDDLALLHTLRELQRAPCMAIAASSSGAPGPLQPRRHSHSPRGSNAAGTAVRLGVVRGVEKTSARGRCCGGKRSFGDDISAQLLKKARLSPFGSGHPHPFAAAVGDVSMSP